MPGRYFTIWMFLAVTLHAPSAGAVAGPCPPSHMQKTAAAVSVPVCVDMCSSLVRGANVETKKMFAENCAWHLGKQSHPVLSAAYDTARWVRVANVCLFLTPIEGYVISPLELVTEIPQMISYLVSALDQSEAARFWSECSAHIECRRGLARNTIRFEHATDGEIDRQVSQVSFNELLVQARHDHAILRDDCMQRLGEIRSALRSDGEDFTPERNKIAFVRLTAERPICPGILHLDRPHSANAKPSPPKSVADVTKPAKLIDKGECLRTNPQPWSCLPENELIDAGESCLGQDLENATDQERMDVCSQIFSLLLPLSGTEFKALAKVGKNAVEVTKVANEVHVVEEVATSPVLAQRMAFVEDHRALVFVEPAQNAKFIELNKDAASQIKENRTRIFDGENAAMKTLNDTSKDKNLVTAITNLQKKIVLGKIKELQREFPGFTFDAYSDFKSLKFAVKTDKEITPELNEQLRSAFDRVYHETNTEFAGEMKRLNIKIDKVGDPKTWFKAGFGRTVDEASLASRRGRSIGGEPRVLDYSKPEVSRVLTERLAQIEKSRQSLVTLPGHKKLFEWSDGVSLPREDVFAVARKNPKADDFALALRERYALAYFLSADAARLQDYIHGVDEFSPTLLIGKRENATLDRASNGGVSADFLGMGAANLHATAKGIAGKYDLASALQGARTGEQNVTGVFRAKMEKFKAKVGGEVTCSGDDCVRLGRPQDAPLSAKEKQAMVQSLAASPDTRGVRLSFVGPGVPDPMRMQLAAQGEAIEKTLRKELSGKVAAEKLDRITFGLDMQTTRLNQGMVNLIVGKSALNRLSSAEQLSLQEAFERALQKSNQDGSQYIQGTTQMRQNTLILVPGPALLNELTNQNEN